jgi:hypothetical protein
MLGFIVVDVIRLPPARNLIPESVLALQQQGQVNRSMGSIPWEKLEGPIIYLCAVMDDRRNVSPWAL